VIVLHIGFPKCGSTSIQHFMALNADRLAAHAVLYPQTGRPRGAGQGPTHAHVNLAWQFLMRGKYSASFGTWEELRALAVQRSDAQIVVSSDAFVQFGPD
jgi:hypothetical protein